MPIYKQPIPIATDFTRSNSTLGASVGSAGRGRRRAPFPFLWVTVVNPSAMSSSSQNFASMTLLYSTPEIRYYSRDLPLLSLQ